MLVALAGALRPRQWTKNVFVLAPLVFAQSLVDPTSLVMALAAFASFCFASSSVYLFNDIRDREEDRRHPVKKWRPIASGALPVPIGAIASVILAALAIAIGWFLGTKFVAVVLLYLALNFLYSSGLKNVVLVDVVMVSLGFVLRVQAGGIAIGVEVSAWLLLCTILVSLLLALSKRRHELILLSKQAAEQRQVLQSYSPLLLDQMINVVTASTVMAYALYAMSPETAERFHTPYLIYTLPFVLYGIFRYLYLTYQKESELNPTEEMLHDPPFLANIALWGTVVLAIIYLA